MSLLLDLPTEDLQPLSKQRVEELFAKSSLSPATLRANRHVPWEIQENIAYEIRARLPKIQPLLGWTQPPTGVQLETVCDLIFRFLNKRALQEYRINSGAQLAWHLNALRMGDDLSAYVKTCVGRRHPNETPSDAVETALRLVRNVICQRFPRDLMTIEALQRDVLGGAGLQVANYAFFAEQAENLFMPSVLFALDEYGIPIQTAQRLRGPCCRHHHSTRSCSVLAGSTLKTPTCRRSRTIFFKMSGRRCSHQYRADRRWLAKVGASALRSAGLRSRDRIPAISRQGRDQQGAGYTDCLLQVSAALRSEQSCSHRGTARPAP